jgi:hypothetical protein
MKLIALFSTGDGYTWSYDHVICVECESAEKLLVDFEAEVRRAAADRECEVLEYEHYCKEMQRVRSNKKATEADYERAMSMHPKRDTHVHFFDQEWSLDTFYDFDTRTINNIEILTLDEWFAQNVINA